MINKKSSFPNSRKVYVTGSRKDIRVPMREIHLSPTDGIQGKEENPPLTVYDTVALIPILTPKSTLVKDFLPSGKIGF